jgi:hypothetical protein
MPCVALFSLSRLNGVIIILEGSFPRRQLRASARAPRKSRSRRKSTSRVSHKRFSAPAFEGVTESAREGDEGDGGWGWRRGGVQACRRAGGQKDRGRASDPRERTGRVIDKRSGNRQPTFSWLYPPLPVPPPPPLPRQPDSQPRISRRRAHVTSGLIVERNFRALPRQIIDGALGKAQFQGTRRRGGVEIDRGPGSALVLGHSHSAKVDDATRPRATIPD